MTGTEVDETAALLDDRYRLGECVGEGGMARVYRAEDVVLGRTVAIKLIRPGVDGAPSERARSEMTVLASLNHPSLVTLFDARLVPGKPEYLAMEFVDGPTLGALLAAGPLPAEVVATPRSRARGGAARGARGRHRASRHQTVQRPVESGSASRCPPARQARGLRDCSTCSMRRV